MAKLRMQVIILAACLIGVIAAKHYVEKLANQAGIEAEPGKTSGSAADHASTVQLP